AADGPFATNSARVARLAELREVLAAPLRALGKDDALRLLRQAGVPVGPVNDVAEAFELARSLELDAVWQVDGVQQVRTPFRLSADPPRPTIGAPGLDAQGQEVREWLGAVVGVEPAGSLG